MSGMRDERVGRALRAIRIDHGWRQEDLAKKAGTSQSTIARIERGDLRSVPVGAIQDAFAVMGGALVLNPAWHGGALDRLLDERHALLSGCVASHLRRSGWTVVPEVTFSVYGERGSVDLLAGHQPTRTGLVVEIKSELTTLEGTQRALDVKVRLARRFVHERLGWRPVVVGRLLILPEGHATRARLERHREMLALAFPSRGWEVRRWIRQPSGAVAGLWVLSNSPEATATRLSPARQRVRRHMAPTS